MSPEELAIKGYSSDQPAAAGESGSVVPSSVGAADSSEPVVAGGLARNQLRLKWRTMEARMVVSMMSVWMIA